MIYDCFLFNNEFDTLDIRLNVLSPIVDKFVLVECQKTFRGKQKPLCFSDNKYLFRKYEDKIIHVIADSPPHMDFEEKKKQGSIGNIDWRQIKVWEIEFFQRDAIAKGLVECEPNDVILISDVDEIPRVEIIDGLDFSVAPFFTLKEKMCCYYLDTYFEEPWHGTTILKYKNLIRKGASTWRRLYARGYKIENGGWHFGRLVGKKEDAIDKLRDAISSLSVYEFDTEQINNGAFLKKCLAELVVYQNYYSSYGTKMKTDDVSNLPRYVQDNYDRFKDYFYDGSNG